MKMMFRNEKIPDGVIRVGLVFGVFSTRPPGTGVSLNLGKRVISVGTHKEVKKRGKIQRSQG